MILYCLKNWIQTNNVLNPVLGMQRNWGQGIGDKECHLQYQYTKVAVAIMPSANAATTPPRLKYAEINRIAWW